MVNKITEILHNAVTNTNNRNSKNDKIQQKYVKNSIKNDEIKRNYRKTLVLISIIFDNFL